MITTARKTRRAILGAVTLFALATAAALPALASEANQAAVVWGNEKSGGVKKYRRALLTPDPNRVEVLHFVGYTPSKWAETEPLYQAWKASLPATVDVVMLPLAAHNAPAWPETIVYYAARTLGQAEAAHREIARRLARPKYRDRNADERIDDLLQALNIPRSSFENAVGDPLRETVATANARWAVQHHARALKQARIRVGTEPRGWPTIIVNGKYILNTHRRPDPVRTYQRANRMIRNALDTGPAHSGPTDNTQLAAYMRQHAGEIFFNQGTGDGKTPMVYNAWKDEVWHLNNRGMPTHVATLKTDDGPAYWAAYWDGIHKRLQEPWRRTDEFVFMRARGGGGINQRAAAFLFTDWLSDPDRMAMPFPFKGNVINVKYDPDGTATTTIDGTSLAGNWWLQAGELRVAFPEHGEDYWPWSVHTALASSPRNAPCDRDDSLDAASRVHVPARSPGTPMRAVADS